MSLFDFCVGGVCALCFVILISVGCRLWDGLFLELFWIVGKVLLHGTVWVLSLCIVLGGCGLLCLT